MNILDHASYSASDVTIESREFLFRGFIQVEKVNLTHRLFHRSEYSPIIQRELIHRPEAAGVLLYNNQQQRFALIEQFRVGALNDSESAWQLEIIAGVLDGNESPETCIRRESLEESGCEINELQHLFSFYPSAGACAEFFIYMLQKLIYQVMEASLVFQMKEKIFNSICLITLKSRCYSKIIA